MNIQNFLRKTYAAVCCMAVLACAAAPAVGAEEYYDYSLEVTVGDFGITDFNTYAIPKSYTYEKTMDYFGEDGGVLRNPQDVFVDQNDNLYIADTDNNRIVRVNPEGELTGIFDNSENGGFNQPTSVFVDDVGAIYVADTGNQRVVRLSDSGRYVEEFVKPESDLLDSDFTFSPKKIAVSPTGYLYAIRHQWLMNIDAYNNFRGFVGATQVAFDPIYLIRKFFANEKQKVAMQKQEPVSVVSFDMMDNGMIYATTVDGLVKKLNSVGKNIYPKSTPFATGTIAEDGKSMKSPNLLDIAVSEEEVIFLLEEWSKSIYVYDSEGENLVVVDCEGTGKEDLVMPTALDIDSGNRIYVADAGQNCIKVYEPTYFMETVFEAVRYYNDGNYGKDILYWQEASKISENYRLSNRGIAKSYLKQGRYEESMEYYLLARDRVGYSKAFAKFRYQEFRENFAFVTFLVILGAAAVILIVKYLNRFIEWELSKYHDII